MIRDECRAYRRKVLLNQLDVDAGRHATECAECRLFADAERSVAGIVRAHRPPWRASAALRERIAGALEAERLRSTRVSAPRRRRTTLALVAALLLALATIALLWRFGSVPRGSHMAHATAELIADDHLKFAHRGDERLQIASESPLSVQGFFEAELGLAAKIPDLRGAKLVGGRRCNLGGRPAALAFFEANREPDELPQRVSLFVFEPAGEDWSDMKEVAGLRGKRACYHEKRGVGILVWEERGLAYVLAGALESADLAHMLLQ